MLSDSSPVVIGTSAGRSGMDGFVEGAPKAAGVPVAVAEPKTLAGAVGAAVVVVVVVVVAAVVAAAPKAGVVVAPPKADVPGAEAALN